MTRYRRLAVELLLIAVAVTALVTGVLYAVEANSFDHPTSGADAWRSFIDAARVLSALGTAAAWVVWLAWRRRARLDAQPDGPARLLAIGVAMLPTARRDWGRAMTAELASLSGRGTRWRFAAGGVRAAIAPPPSAWRPAAGWAGGTVGILGVMGCVATTVHVLGADAGADVTPAAVIVVLLVVLAGCLVTTLAAPPALTSSPLARHVGLVLGVAAGVALLVWSRAGGLEAGAMSLIIPAQLLAFVIAPALVAAVARSFGAALQCIVWGFVFGSVTMFPVYIVESIRRYRTIGGLYLDGDAPAGHTLAANLTDAVAWLLLVVPSVLVPVGVLIAALTATIARAVRPA